MDDSIFLPDGVTLSKGKYTIVRAIAAGGFGCTYEAVDNLTMRRVAIKEFFVKDFCNRHRATGRLTVGSESKIDTVGDLLLKFLEEAQALSQMSHPGIVHVHEVFEENSTAYYVMDYIDGPTLARMTRNGTPLDQDTAIAYIVKVAEALRYVHSCGRLHLDVKPENIMVSNDGSVKLIDFGVSKVFDDHKGAKTSSIAGVTMGYASLEQSANDIRMLTYASDIYSLGATLYTLLTGVVPPPATALAAGKQLDPLPPHISPVVQQLIIECMASQVSLRPHDIDEFLARIAPVVPAMVKTPHPIPQAPYTDSPYLAYPPTVYGPPISVGFESKEGYPPHIDNPKKKLSGWTMLIVGVVIALLSFVLAYGFFHVEKDGSSSSSKTEDVSTVATDSVPASVESVGKWDNSCSKPT